MKKTIFILLIACFIYVNKGWSQERTTLGVSYQYALPMGSFKDDLISKGSPRGFALDILYAIKPQWRIGGGVSFQDFYQVTARNTYRMSDGSDISAVVSNSLQTTPLLLKGMYLPNATTTSSLQPYVTIGAGVNMIQYTQLLGEFSNGDDVNFRFAAQGGAGMSYKIGQQQTAITLGAVYNYMPYNRFEVKNINNLAFQAGVRIALRNNGRGGRGSDFDDGTKQPNRRY